VFFIYLFDFSAVSLAKNMPKVFFAIFCPNLLENQLFSVILYFNRFF